MRSVRWRPFSLERRRARRAEQYARRRSGWRRAHWPGGSFPLRWRRAPGCLAHSASSAVHCATSRSVFDAAKAADARVDLLLPPGGRLDAAAQHVDLGPAPAQKPVVEVGRPLRQRVDHSRCIGRVPGGQQPPRLRWRPRLWPERRHSGQPVRLPGSRAGPPRQRRGTSPSSAMRCFRKWPPPGRPRHLPIPRPASAPAERGRTPRRAAAEKLMECQPRQDTDGRRRGPAASAISRARLRAVRLASCRPCAWNKKLVA